MGNSNRNVEIRVEMHRYLPNHIAVHAWNVSSSSCDNVSSSSYLPNHIAVRLQVESKHLVPAIWTLHWYLNRGTLTDEHWGKESGSQHCLF
jgi:hypothetical protein